MAGGEGVSERVMVEAAAAADIEQPGASFHQRQAASIQYMMRGGRERRRDGDKICAAQSGIEFVQTNDPVGMGMGPWVQADAGDMHPQTLGAVRDRAAHVAQPDDEDGPPGNATGENRVPVRPALLGDELRQCPV
jgi:hypothetical protein